MGILLLYLQQRRLSALPDLKALAESLGNNHFGRRKTQLDRDVRWNSVILLREKNICKNKQLLRSK